MFLFNTLDWQSRVTGLNALNGRYRSLTLLHFLYIFKSAIFLAFLNAQCEPAFTLFSGQEKSKNLMKAISISCLGHSYLILRLA